MTSKLENTVARLVAETKNKADITLETIARKFGELLLRDIGLDDLKTVNRENAKDASPNICHSHDFCDANMVLAEAFEDSGIEPFPDDEQEMDKVIDLCNKVHGIAKQNNFYI